MMVAGWASGDSVEQAAYAELLYEAATSFFAQLTLPCQVRKRPQDMVKTLTFGRKICYALCKSNPVSHALARSNQSLRKLV